MLVKLRDCYIAANFAVLPPLELPSTTSRENMVILGRPFMVTTRTNIDYCDRKIGMNILGEKFTIEVPSNIDSAALIVDDCNYVDCIDSSVNDSYLQHLITDKLEATLTLEPRNVILDREIEELHETLDNAEF